jgi:hypothetical protein
MGMQIAEVSDFDLNEWDDVDIHGFALTEPEMGWNLGENIGCPSCIGDLGKPPVGGGFPWGTVLIGVGGVGLGVLGAVLIKKYLLK